MGRLELKKMRLLLFFGEGEGVFGEYVALGAGDGIEERRGDVGGAEVESHFEEASLEIGGFDYFFADCRLINLYLSLF
jgi:hypothetical protein